LPPKLVQDDLREFDENDGQDHQTEVLYVRNVLLKVIYTTLNITESPGMHCQITIAIVLLESMVWLFGYPRIDVTGSR
jgi:hypothetical protein